MALADLELVDQRVLDGRVLWTVHGRVLSRLLGDGTRLDEVADWSMRTLQKSAMTECRDQPPFRTTYEN
jgi:hypothetical protein